jgi:5'-phosphate synthase pdxT subunit
VRVGVLALQGAFDAHRVRLEAFGAQVDLIRRIEQLRQIDALVIPGGESTAMLTLLGDAGLGALADFVRERPVLGTCAGAVLLARSVEGFERPGLGALDIRIRRNAYGRQANSFIGSGDLQGMRSEMVFIRAPRIVSVGETVEVIGRLNGEPVAVRQGLAIAATFHPELSRDMRLHRLFLDTVLESGGRARHS